MKNALWQSGKRSAGWLLAKTSSKYHYKNCIFILAHMRCGSTALSNILCSRPEISGYGEAHVRYDGENALGQLALNQLRRGGWKTDATFLFDKILHSRHDSAAPPNFTEARAIFMVRRPRAAIRSITELYERLGRAEYRTHEQAAIYYVERVEALCEMWKRFPRERRVGLTHTRLIQDPESALAQISTHLGFDPPLANRYVSPRASRKGGGGDPLVSGQHTRIEKGLLRPTETEASLGIGATLAQSAEEAYEKFRELVAREWPDMVAD